MCCEIRAACFCLCLEKREFVFRDFDTLRMDKFPMALSRGCDDIFFLADSFIPPTLVVFPNSEEISIIFNKYIE